MISCAGITSFASLLMYLHEKDGTALLRRITRQFPSGQIAFDAYSGASE